MRDMPIRGPSPDSTDTDASSRRDRRDDAALPRDPELLGWASRLARFGGWYVELGSGTVHWSDEVCAIHEVPAGTVVTPEQGIASYHPDDRDTIRDAYERCVDTGEAWDLELRLITATGREIWVNTLGEPVHDENGTVCAVRGAFQDITRRRLAEERATEMEHRHTAILENMADAFFTVDSDWRFTFVNEGALRLFGKAREALLGRVCWDVFPSGRGTRIEREARSAVCASEAHYFETPLRLEHLPADTWVSVKTYPTDDGLAVYFRDISERRERIRRMAEQASLIDRAADAIIVWDAERRVRLWNAGASRVFERESSDVVGRDVLDVLGLDADVIGRAMHELKRVGEWRGQLVATDRHGESVVLDARWTLVQDGADDPPRVLAINTDITEREHLRQQFLRAQRLESVGTMAGGIAHDLNNVLTPIRISAENLRHEVDGGAAEDCLRAIETCTERGTALLDRLLSFVRGAEVDREHVDLHGLVHDVVHVIRETFPRDVRVESDLAEDLWNVAADATQLNQVLMNLCVNARDAMPTGGVLRVQAENRYLDEEAPEIGGVATRGRYVVISVSDTGTGMDPATLRRAFDPFFTTKASAYGTGLGLATVDAIVQGHDGFVRAYSEVGEGSRFRIYLPAEAASPNVAGAAQDVSEDVSGRPSDRRGRGETVLVADDEELIANGVARVLERHGYRVLVEHDGAAAVSTFGELRDEVRAIIIDVMMPVMDGLDATRAIREIDPDVPIIATTGLASGPKRDRLREVGVAEIVLKPYRIDTLLSILGRELDGPARRSA